jgi:hypothetical protein
MIEGLQKQLTILFEPIFRRAMLRTMLHKKDRIGNIWWAWHLRDQEKLFVRTVNNQQGDSK